MDEQTVTRLADQLTGDGASTVLRAVLEAAGAVFHHSSVRSVHRRGGSGVAVVHRVRMTDRRGAERDRLFVTHASTRSVPAGAATLRVDGATVHVWQFPDDPYLPGLRPAVNRVAAATLLTRVGEGAPVTAATVGVHTRSYRPTRRAVVELRPDADAAPTAYVKLLGGRDERRRRRRTQRLVAVHDVLGDAGLPVPAVLEHDVAAGQVVLAAVPGATLRSALREGGELPRPAAVAHLLGRLWQVEDLPPGGDPDGFAGVVRHVPVLAARLPDRRGDLEHLAEVAASVGGPTGPVHGDLHDGQLLVADEDVVGVLDVDGAGTGHLAHDVGRLLAHVEASALVSDADTARVDRYVADLTAALVEVAPERDVAAAAAGAWVGLATGPLRVASPTWRDDVATRLDRALAWAGRA